MQLVHTILHTYCISGSSIGVGREVLNQAEHAGIWIHVEKLLGFGISSYVACNLRLLKQNKTISVIL